MTKELRCGDLMPGCPTVIEGSDDNDVLAQAAEHARQVHQIGQVTPDLEKQVRAAIHEKP